LLDLYNIVRWPQEHPVQQSITTQPVPYFRGVPEVAFGMESVSTLGSTAQGTMRPGAWAARGDGRLHQGCIGVLVDNVTGYAVLTARAGDYWAVSSAISIDFHEPLAADTQRIRCAASLDHRSSGWGHASGRVTTDTGELVATVSQRLRFVPGFPAGRNEPDEPAGTPSSLPALGTLLSVTEAHADEVDLRLSPVPGMRNPIGTLHGGVALCASEVAAHKAWALSPKHPGEAFHTASIRISYLRPGDLEGDLTLKVTTLHASRSVVLADVQLRNPGGEVATRALCTLHRSATDL
jgi:uncharacterized protein (TIGR00369 family)